METSPGFSGIGELGRTGRSPNRRRWGERTATQGIMGGSGEGRGWEQTGGKVRREPSGLGWWGPKAQSPQFV